MGRIAYVIMVWLLLVGAPLAARPAEGGRPVVTTAYGTAVGTVGDGVEIFQGVPYAAPPTGPRRWAPPVAPARWTKPLDAGRPGSACPQSGPAGGIAGSVPGENEDCLFLNIWRPAVRTPGARLPILVWFHGGGMQTGAAHLYRASRLVTHGRPIIVVTVNYRLNIFGFLAHEALDAEHPDTGSGNYGILDQLFALAWVRDNIGRFGGDPARVTIAGESGGAQAVCVLLASPRAKGLFHAAISQSGACQWKFPLLSASDAKGAELAAAKGCTGSAPLVVRCLRGLPVAALLSGAPGTGAPSGAPSVGGGVLPLNIREAVALGAINIVPMLEGATEDEGLYYVAPFFDGVGKPVRLDEYDALLAGFFGSSAAKVRQHYPPANYPSPSYAFSRAISDSGAVFMSRIGACNTRLGNRLLASRTTLYAFEFADPRAPFPAPMFPFETGGMVGPGHTSELTFLFDNDAHLTPAQTRLAETMIGYWTNFVTNGDPNGASLPRWPRFTLADEQVQRLDSTGVRATTTYAADHECAFWESLGYNSLYGWAGEQSPPPPRR